MDSVPLVRSALHPASRNHSSPQTFQAVSRAANKRDCRRACSLRPAALFSALSHPTAQVPARDKALSSYDYRGDLSPSENRAPSPHQGSSAAARAFPSLPLQLHILPPAALAPSASELR